MNYLFQSSPPSLKPASPWWAGILPWLAFGVVQLWSTRWAAPVALIVFAVLNWPLRRALPPLDAGIGFYFLLDSILGFTGLAQQLPPPILFALCPAILAMTAIGSIFAGRPFTLAYAHRYAPEHIRERHAFFQANQILTLLWAVGFATTAIAISTLPAPDEPTQAALIFISVMGTTTAASIIIGCWLHVRISRLAS
ncbi:MAG TPA: hypothetical protein VK737_08290 [Opitutales bacterium]|jgi:hypothetical protein|nr:hypothetical protein [Opitutales bacterium]